jgi:hypothetical protein
MCRTQIELLQSNINVYLPDPNADTHYLSCKYFNTQYLENQVQES